jgi:histidine kinase-like protein
VMAFPGEDELEVKIADHGRGFQPRASDEATLGLGLPLIAALSDSFEISGSAGHGSTTTIRFGYAPPDFSSNGGPEAVSEDLAMAITPGAMVRPVLARVIGALAARAEFSVDRLADTVLLGDAVSTSGEGEFYDGQLGILINEDDGTLDVRVGPLVQGAGQRLLSDMDVPGAGSLRSLAKKMEIVQGTTAEGDSAEFLAFEIDR